MLFRSSVVFLCPGTLFSHSNRLKQHLDLVFLGHYDEASLKYCTETWRKGRAAKDQHTFYSVKPGLECLNISVILSKGVVVLH